MPRYGFSGEIPRAYDEGLGALLFEPYAVATAARVAALRGPIERGLELAAGTGRLTAHLLAATPVRWVATDLQPAMLDVARERLPREPRLRWEVADAADLPYEDGAFDLVVSGFGIMFVRERDRAHAEARRVLRPGGTYLFTTWAGHAGNPWAGAMQAAMDEVRGAASLPFFRAPFAYGDEGEIEADLRRAGFGGTAFETISREIAVPDAAAFARAALLGTPAREALAEAPGDVEAIASRFAAWFGSDSDVGESPIPMRSATSARLVSARRETPG